MKGKSISNFDRDTILLQIHPELATRKVLLVGHSQGTFYANAIYDYLLAHGEPRAAVGAYHVASPASSVAGGGTYLNSSGDALLGSLRGAGFKMLADNIDLVPSAEEAQRSYPGHSFSGAYLAGAPERVVGDIQKAIGGLKAEQASNTGECFTAPEQGLSYNAAKAGFAIADTAASVTKTGLVGAQKFGVAVGDTLLAAAAGAFGVGKKVAKDVGITVGGITNFSQAATDKVRPTNFDIFEKLYGSSLTKEEVKELLGDQGSAVATADIFSAPEPATTPAPAATAEVASPAPKKIIYLSGSRGNRDDGEESEVATEEPAPAPPVPNETEGEPAPEPEVEPEPEPEPDPSPLLNTVVISELAWAGGYSAPADQWIELYNRAQFDIDLSAMYLVMGSGAPLQLSGTLAPGEYLVLERTDDSVRSLAGLPYAATLDFAPLATEPTQVSLVLADGAVVDATPAASACGSAWCAGGITTTGYADWHGNPFPVSMERVDMDEDGTDPDNWASNDGYTRHHQDAMQQHIVGTPGQPNSTHWPLVGFFCGNQDILVPGAAAQPYGAQGACTGLMGGTSYFMSVGGGVFKGQIGSATDVETIYFPGRFSGSNQKWGTISLPALEPGEYFVGMWEYSTVIGSGYSADRIGDLYAYLKTGFHQDGVTPGAPELTYVTIPFVIE